MTKDLTDKTYDEEELINKTRMTIVMLREQLKKLKCLGYSISMTTISEEDLGRLCKHYENFSVTIEKEVTTTHKETL